MPKVHSVVPRFTSRPNYANALLSVWQNTDLQPGQESVVYARILEVAQHILPVDHASIWLLQPTDQASYLNCIQTTQSAMAVTAIAVTEIAHYLDYLQQAPILSCDNANRTQADYRPIMQEMQPYLQNVKAVMHLRLMDDGELLGVLRLETARAHHWTADEQTFGLLLAEQIVHVLQHEDRTRIQHELELVSRVFNASRDAIVVMSNVGIVQKVNPAFTTITGFAPEEIVGQHYPTWVNQGGQTDVDFASICSLVTAEGHWHGELMQRRKDTHNQAVWQTMLSVKDTHGMVNNYISIETDLSAHKMAQERLHYLSYYDSLTGMGNRQLLLSHFFDLFARADEQNAVVGVIYVDIDDFKKVNLSMGHALGDQLLTTVASRLTQVQFEGGLWARLSADEFAYAGVFPNGDALDMLIAAIVRRISEPFAIGGQMLRLTASIGAAFYPQDARDAESILKAAQSAMRAAKSTGGNSQRYYETLMSQQAEARLLLETQLSHAVKDHQLVLHYQPQYDLTTGRIIGTEALVRWQHPELGLVSPTLFIPLAEETGLIEEIGDWVLGEACRQLAEWQRAGVPVVTMAVNVSASQFIRQPIVQRVAQLLREYQLAPNLLELELTESVVMHDPMHVRSIMRELSDIGVQLSIDDFGTGYSSLSYLQKFPLDKLKIDMSFVRDIVDSKDNLAIAKAIVQLGKSMELTVIAEGIETLAQQQMLNTIGCHEGQGFYYARPLPAAELLTKLRASSQ